MSGSSASEYLRRLVEENPELLKRGGVFRRSSVHESADWLRIVALPRRDIDLSTVPDLTPLFQKPGGTMRLWPIQSLALLEAERCQGAFIAIPVGGGKSLTAALMPEALQSKCTVLLVPAQLKRRTLETVYPELSKHFNLPLDRLHVVSYSELERAVRGVGALSKAWKWLAHLSAAIQPSILEELKPDLIIADEAHLLKNKEPARTAKCLRYLKEHENCRFVVMTGTFTDRSLLDYAHLIKRALRDGSPLPNYYGHLVEWAEALDVSDDPRPPGALLRLCERKDHLHVDPNGRDHFGCRLVSTPGVIAQVEGFTGVPLTIRRRPITPPPKVIAALERLRKSWIVGDPQAPEDASEEVNDDLSFARFARQLACGFYLRWVWPEGKRDVDWLARRSAWAKVVRHVLRYQRRPGLDTDLQVANAAIRGELHKDQLLAWEAWAEVKGKKQPPTVPVWIDRYIVEDACEWASVPGSGIVWFEHRALGEAIAAELGQRLPDNAADIANDGRPLVLSAKQFGTGVDGLQRSYQRMLFTTVPNGKLIEQTLGRLHREGQRHAVTADLLLPTIEVEEKLKKTFAQSRYMQTTKFGAQKLLSASLEGIDLGL